MGHYVLVYKLVTTNIGSEGELQVVMRDACATKSPREAGLMGKLMRLLAGDTVAVVQVESLQGARLNVKLGCDC